MVVLNHGVLMEYPLVLWILEENMMSNMPVSFVDREPEIMEDELVVDGGDGQIIARPDGYYWQAPDGKQEFGPFETLELAQADRERSDEEAPEPGETLQEAEDEIGIASWIDPETGEPAEGLSIPRFE